MGGEGRRADTMLLANATVLVATATHTPAFVGRCAGGRVVRLGCFFARRMFGGSNSTRRGALSPPSKEKQGGNPRWERTGGGEAP